MTEVYARDVAEALAGEFSDLDDGGTRRVITDLIVKLAAGDVYEVIIDDPARANWRLYPNSSVPGRVLLSCAKIHPSADDWARLERVNESLSAL